MQFLNGLAHSVIGRSVIHGYGTELNIQAINNATKHQHLAVCTRLGNLMVKIDNPTSYYGAHEQPPKILAIVGSMDLSKPDYRMLKGPTSSPPLLFHNSDMELVDSKKILFVVLGRPGIGHHGN